MNMMTLSQGQPPVSGGFRVSLSELYEAVRGRAERAQLIGSLASFWIMDLRTVRRIAWFADDVKAWQTGIKKVA